MTGLTQKQCIPCQGGIPPLSAEKIQELLPQVPQWNLEGNTIVREFKFKNFKEAIIFINQVAEIAEYKGHHPDIYLHGWNKVKLTLFTHEIKGLHENDFIVAAKIDPLIKDLK